MTNTAADRRRLSNRIQVVCSVVAILTIAGVPSHAAQASAGQLPAPPDTPPAGLFAEPRVVSTSVSRIGRFSDSDKTNDGFFPRFGGMMPGAGWITLGPGYRRHFFGGRARIQASAALSWREYAAVEARAEFSPRAAGPLTIGAQALWQDLTQVNYFGAGSASLKSGRSEYRLRAADTSAFAIARSGRVTIGARLGVLQQPRISAPAGWNDPGHPYTATVFSDDAAPGLARQTPFLHADVTTTFETLDRRGHPRRGSILEAHAAAYHDRQDGAFSFRRYELSAAHFTPLSPRVWTLAARASAVFSDTSGGSRVPFYMLPSLGSENGLRGFLDYRFADRNLSVVNVESRWALWPHLDVALFADAGAVAATAGALAHAAYHRDAGIGLRLHTGRTTIVRLDVARSAEGWRVLFKTGESLRFSAMAHWAAIVPTLF